MSYIGAEPDGMGKAQRFTFTASGGETVVSADDDGIPIGYTANQVSVYLNGVKLVVGTGKDCQATNGSTITGLAALAASDVVEVVALSIFSATTVEGTALISTGETGGTKFLREDGDATSSWQEVIPVYADNSARDDAIPSPANGMIIYNTAAGALQQYNGGWSTITPSPDISSVSGFLNDDTDSTLTIHGTNFNSASVVKMFDASSAGSQIGSNATTTFNSVTKLTAVFGSGSIGASGSTAYIEVDNAGIANRFVTAITVNADPTVVHAGATGTSANTTTHLGTYGGASTGGGDESTTRLLLNFDRADGSTDFEDSANSGGDGYKVTATGNAHIETDQYKFGTAQGKANNTSVYFDGVGDFLFSDVTGLGIADITIDMWIYPITQVASDGDVIFVDTRSTSGTNGFFWSYQKATGSLRLYTGVSPTFDIVFNDNNLSLNTWTHIAIERHSGTVRCYVNGVQDTTTATSNNSNFSNAQMWIGINSGESNSHAWKGYIDVFRISTTARYSGTNFTPETSLYGAVLSKTIPTITFTGTATQLASDEDIEFTSVANTTKPANNQHLTDSGIGLVLTNLTGGDKNKATLTGTIASGGGTTHSGMPVKAQVRKTLGSASYNDSTAVTFPSFDLSSATVNTDATVTATMTNIRVGMGVSGTNIPDGATVISVAVSTFELSANATGTATSTLTYTTLTTGLAPAMPVSGTGINASATISTVDSTTAITLSHATTGGARTFQDLVFEDLTRVAHVNGAEVLATGDSMLSIATAAGGDPVLFNGRRYIGTEATRDITEFGFQPDLLWIKNRGVVNNHFLVDSVRGAGKRLQSNSFIAEGSQDLTLHSEFNSDGFGLGTSTSNNANANNNKYVAWGWKAGGTPSGELVGTDATMSGTSGAGTIHNSATGVSNVTSLSASVSQTSGFSITTFTGHDSGGAFPHNLDGTPAFIAVKRLNGASSWCCWHQNLTATTGKNLVLNTDGAEGSDATVFSTAPSSTLITLGTNNEQGGATAGTYVCYAWKAVAGVSAFGTYEGGWVSGGSGVTTVTTGFQPKMIIIKNMDTTNDWVIVDAFRGTTDASPKLLHANTNEVEQTDDIGLEFISTGFTIIQNAGSGLTNNTNETYIYAAFA